VAQTACRFPFQLTPEGAVAVADEEQRIRQRLAQILFTSPGERVMLPDFGCRLRDLIFAGNSDVLAAATEFTVARALQTYMGNDIMINEVHTESLDEQVVVTVVYTKASDLQKARAEFKFLPMGAANG
jgi:uncharacterized protein